MHLQLSPVNFAPPFFLRPGVGGAPPGYAYGRRCVSVLQSHRQFISNTFTLQSLYSLTSCGLTSQKSNQGSLGLSGLFHEEAHPCMYVYIYPNNLWMYWCGIHQPPVGPVKSMFNSHAFDKILPGMKWMNVCGYVLFSSLHMQQKLVFDVIRTSLKEFLVHQSVVIHVGLLLFELRSSTSRI